MDRTSRSRKQRCPSKILSFVLIFQLKAIFMLYIEAIPRALLGADYFSSSLGIFLLVCNVFQFICFFVINYFTIHFFTLRVPNSYIPWA